MDYQQQLALFSCLPAPAFKGVNSTNKRVRMNPTVLVHDIIGLKSLTKQKKSQLFYTKDDYNMTVLEIKAIVLTNQPPETPSYTTSCSDEEDNDSSNTSMHAAEADDFLRGIELQMYPQRFQNKLVARKALLKYQTYLHAKRTNMTPEQKAEAMRKASEKLSTWSHLVAQETARLDSIRAYDRDYLIPLNGVPVQFSTYPDLTFQRKGSEDQEVPRVTSEDRPHRFKKARAAGDEALPLP